MNWMFRDENELRTALRADKQKRLYAKIMDREQRSWRKLLRKLGLREDAKTIAQRKAYEEYRK